MITVATTRFHFGAFSVQDPRMLSDHFNFAVQILLPQIGLHVWAFSDTMLYHSEWWHPHLHPKWWWVPLLFRGYCDVMPRSPTSGSAVGRQPLTFVICLGCHATFPGSPHPVSCQHGGIKTKPPSSKLGQLGRAIAASAVPGLGWDSH